MNLLKKCLAFVLILCLVIPFASCGKNTEVDNSGVVDLPTVDGYGGGDSRSDIVGGGGYYSGKSSGGIISDAIHYSEGLSAESEGYAYDYYDEYGYPAEEEILPGLITAKAWNDNEYYEQWKSLFSRATDNDPDGKFYDFTDNKWAFDTSNRVKVTVTKGGEPAVGVKVEYIYPNQTAWTSKTDANGVAYVFPSEESGKITVAGKEAEFSAETRDLTVEIDSAAAKSNVIKLMFVIDATGSMGDEMRYITAELVDVISRVAEQAEQVRIELALLFYRDDGDQEKFAYHDFEIVSQEYGLEKQLKVLKAQRADGGGDTPEAVDEAMVIAANKNWGDENSTNLIFLVLDAPPHENQDNVKRCAEAVKVASEKGIRICPVLCSGADTLCEYLTRTGALLTGGISVFVTDDSGIGGEHLDPDLPDATVECLNDLMVRLIVGYHTGTFAEPVAWQPPEETQQPQETTDVIVVD